MRTQRDVLSTLVDRDFFESMARYRPDRGAYIEPVAKLLPAGWDLACHGVWCHCAAPGANVPAHGWKIHLSATNATARAMIAAAVPVLVDAGASFKLAVDPLVLGMMNSKRWSRGGSGKFITVYPADADAFRTILDALDAATREIEGPYILSDRRYRDSRTVFYRYGTMRKQTALDVSGRQLSYIEGPSGQIVFDNRSPYFSLPSWVEDPFPRPATGGGEANTLNDGRYLVEKALAHSNSGGVYKALDRRIGRTVIIKEARPAVTWASGSIDAQTLLRKEHRILQTLAPTGVAPQAYELFTDWEHLFLVEEFIDAPSLSQHLGAQPVLLQTRPTDEDYQRHLDRLRDIFGAVARAVEAAHASGIVLCDLSPNNVLVRGDRSVRLIDFEAAWVDGIDEPTQLATPGFAPPIRNGGSRPCVEDDYYAFAALVMSYVAPVTPFFDLDPDSRERVIGELLGCARIPSTVIDAVSAGMSLDLRRRPRPGAIAQALDRAPAAAAPYTPPPVTTAELDSTISRALDYITAKADPGRADRLFPGDSRIFQSNAVGVSYGAAGVLSVLHRLGRPLDEAWIAWLLSKPLETTALPPGFSTGQAGIAWALLELGHDERAASVMRASRAQATLLATNAGFLHGLAGWGMTALALYRRLGEAEFLADARFAAERLSHTARRDSADRPFWPYNGKVRLGLHHGGAGVAHFLLALSASTGADTFLELGRQALAHDIAHGKPMPGAGTSWSYTTDANTPLLPYASYGTAGIVGVALRFRALLQDDAFDAAIAQGLVDLERWFSVAPGLYMGLAGIGETLLDAALLTGDDRYLQQANRLARGILVFRIGRPEGTAFPGDALARISCDLGTGVAGIASFLDRLARPRPAAFTLDTGPTHAPMSLLPPRRPDGLITIS